MLCYLQVKVVLPGLGPSHLNEWANGLPHVPETHKRLTSLARLLRGLVCFDEGLAPELVRCLQFPQNRLDIFHLKRNITLAVGLLVACCGERALFLSPLEQRGHRIHGNGELTSMTNCSKRSGICRSLAYGFMQNPKKICLLLRPPQPS